MAAVKRFLLHHGEKVGFAVVALLALWSLSVLLFQNPDALRLPDGKVETIDLDDVERTIRRVRTHIQSSKRTTDDVEVKPVGQMVLDAVEQYRRPIAEAVFRWLVYVKPPQPTLLKPPKPVIPRIGDPPAEYITRLAAPAEWRIKVGGGKIALACRDSSLLRWPKKGTVRVVLFRKAIGEAREDLKAEVREQYESAAAGGAPVSGRESEGPREGFFDFGAPPAEAPADAGMQDEPGAGQEFGAPSDETGRMPAEEETGPRIRTDEQGFPLTYADYVRQVRQREREVYRGLGEILDANARMETRWRLLHPDLPAYAQAPDLAEALEGRLPRPLLRREARAEEERERPTPSADRDDPFGAFMGGGPNRDVEVVEERPYEARWYAFVDEDVEENTIYRYRLVVRCEPRPLPKSLLEEEPRYAGYDLRVEVGGMGTTMLALPKDRFQQWVRREEAIRAEALAEIPEARRLPTFLAWFDAQALQPDFPRFDALEREEGMLVTRKENGRLKPLWAGYAAGEALGPFAYTGVVLTPVRTTFSLNGILRTGDKPPIATIQITIRTETGETLKKSYSVTPPRLPRPLTLRDLVKTDASGNVIRENGLPVRLDPEAIYAKLKPFAATPIGQRESEKRDFRTGWGLVDIRRCVVSVQKYSLVPVKREGDEVLDEEGNPVLEWEKRGSPLAREEDYLVVRELDPPEGQAPRYKRVPRVIKRGDEKKEDVRYVRTYDWEPKLTELIETMKKNRGGGEAGPE